MIAPVTHILPLASVKRSRMLPAKGRVLVRVGQKVNASDVIAEVEMPGAHTIINVRRIFGLRRGDQLAHVLERKVGDKVEAGDILAQTGGLLSRVIRAPANGQVIAIHRGQIVLERLGNRTELQAGLNGIVTEVLPDRGVIIEASGALVQGVWGNGKIDLGMLNIQIKSPDDELTRSTLDVTSRGSIVVAGHVSQADTLQAADELPLRGLVLGSLSSELADLAAKMNYPIMLVEGFGRIPFDSAALSLLTTHDRRDVSIDASWSPERGERPELFVPLPANGSPPKDTVEFAAGQTVRVHAPPYAGKIGSIASLHPGQTRLSNGLRTPTAEIKLETGEFVTVPLANMDVLE
jgi:hypothetical protein